MLECPQKHVSETPGYCSVCGLEIPGAEKGASASASLVPPVAVGGLCPDCGTPRDGASQGFCEVCGYNYHTQASGVPPAPGAHALLVPIPARTSISDHSAPSPAVKERWQVVVEVDPQLNGILNPDAPKDQPPQTFPLFEDEALIGRADTNVRVQIPIFHDVAVSRRHAQLLRQADGGFVVRDLSSANGTQVNGTPIVPGVETRVQDGDVIRIGAWTSIRVRSVAI